MTNPSKNAALRALIYKTYFSPFLNNLIALCLTFIIRNSYSSPFLKDLLIPMHWLSPAMILFLLLLQENESIVFVIVPLKISMTVATKDNPRLINIPPRNSDEWKTEFNARTSAKRSNKREKYDFLLENGRHRSSKMWYCRLYNILMLQHLDSWDLPYKSAFIVWNL